MKRHVLALSTALIVPSLLFAQIPNGGFEDWTASGLGYDDPDGWVTWNQLTWLGNNTLSCAEGTPGAVGASYAIVTTQNVPGLGVLPGLLFTGSQDGIGFPYTGQPEALNGMYKFDIPGGDGGNITVSFTKWNSVTQTSDAIGGGALFIPPGTQASWGSFSIPIAWTAPDQPDTAVVTIMSSTGGGVAGSTVSVDDLSFGAASGITEVTTGAAFQVILASGAGRITIMANEQLAELELMDLSGRVSARERMSGLSDQADVMGLSGGVYLARVRFANGNIATRAFVKN